MSMSTKVKILIGGGGIVPPGMAAPVEIHYKGRPAQPSRGNSVMDIQPGASRPTVRSESGQRTGNTAIEAENTEPEGADDEMAKPKKGRISDAKDTTSCRIPGEEDNLDSGFKSLVHRDNIHPNEKNKGKEVNNRISLRTPVIRPSNDVHIIYDIEHAGDDDPIHLVRKLEDRLEKSEYKYTDCCKDCVLGRLTDQQQKDFITQADFIVCFMSFNQQTGVLSNRVANYVQKALNIKLQSGLPNKILPVFCYITPEQVVEKRIVQFPELVTLEDITAQHGDFTYIEKVMEALAVTPSESHLVKFYEKYLPDKCCPLLRLDKALDVPREMIDLYLQPNCTTQEYRKGKIVRNSPLSSLTSIVDVTEETESGIRIIVSASAGVGKSAFSSHCTRQWCHGQALNKYQLLYLVLPRYIHRHAEPIERIICTDLNLHTEFAETEVRRAITFNSKYMAFIIDGYDELMGKDQLSSSLNDVISGKVANESKVVITTRHHCVDAIIKQCKGNYVLVKLEGLTKAASEEYIEKMCASECDIEYMLAQIPEEARHVPLLLNMAVLIHRWNKQHHAKTNEFLRIRTVSDVIGHIICMFLSLQVDKCEGLDKVPLYLSLLDENLPDRHIIKDFAKMCFEAMKNNELEFTHQTLRHFDFHKGKELSQLGFLEITYDHDDGEGNVEGARCLHNQILEYLAAFHVTKDLDALPNIMKTFSSTGGSLLSEEFGVWQDTVVFATGIDHKIQSFISCSGFSLRVSCDKEDDQHQCLDLSYEARLIHETESTEAREEFCEALMTAPLKQSTKTTEPCLPTLPSVSTFQQSLGANRSIQLLKRVHGDYLVVHGDNAERGELRGIDGKRILTGSMPLLTYITFLSLTDTSHLVLKQANLIVLKDFKQTVTHGVPHIELAGDVTYNIEQLTTLICSVAPAAGLDSLTLRCLPENVTDEGKDSPKVNKLVLKWHAVRMCNISSLIQRLNVNHLEMDDVTLQVEGEDGDYTFLNMNLSLRCERFVDLFGGSSTSPEGRRMANVVTTEDGSGSADRVYVTNSSVCQLGRLAEIITMRQLHVKGNFRDDKNQYRSLNNTSQTEGHGVHHIELEDNVRYSTEQLTSLIGSVGKSAGLATLTLQCPPYEVSDTATHTQKVKKMVFKWCRVSMSAITNLTRHLDVQYIEMDGVNLTVEGMDEQRFRLNDLYLSLRCEWFVDLFMGLSASPEDRRMADVVTTEDGSGSARHVTITNCSVFQLSQLTSLIKMRALYIEGDLRYNRDQHGSLNDVTQVVGGVDQLVVRCSLSMASLITLCHMVGGVNSMTLTSKFKLMDDTQQSSRSSHKTHLVGDLWVLCRLNLSSLTTLCHGVRGVKRIWLGSGCTIVDDTRQSSSSDHNHMVWHVEELTVKTTLSLGLLDCLLRLVHVDKLCLLECEVTCEADDATSLPGINTLVLCDVRGAGTLFGHISAPGVTTVEVLGWESEDEHYAALSRACPNAIVINS